MAKGDAAKPKGRMTAYAYFVKTCREEHQKKHPNENVVFAEFSKKCAERWKVSFIFKHLLKFYFHFINFFSTCLIYFPPQSMNDKEKKRFQSMAEDDKKRYDKEMKNYVPPKTAKKRKRTKDPNAPKRALSAFFWFCKDERPKVRAEQPDSSVSDIAKELGKRWGLVTAEGKKKFEASANRDKARYEKESTAYKKKVKTAATATTSKAKKAAPAAQPDSDEEDEEEESEEEEDDDE